MTERNYSLSGTFKMTASDGETVDVHIDDRSGLEALSESQSALAKRVSALEQSGISAVSRSEALQREVSALGERVSAATHGSAAAKEQSSRALSTATQCDGALHEQVGKVDALTAQAKGFSDRLTKLEGEGAETATALRNNAASVLEVHKLCSDNAQSVARASYQSETLRKEAALGTQLSAYAAASGCKTHALQDLRGAITGGKVEVAHDGYGGVKESLRFYDDGSGAARFEVKVPSDKRVRVGFLYKSAGMLPQVGTTRYLFDGRSRQNSLLFGHADDSDLPRGTSGEWQSVHFVVEPTGDVFLGGFDTLQIALGSFGVADMDEDEVEDEDRAEYDRLMSQPRELLVCCVTAEELPSVGDAAQRGITVYAQRPNLLSGTDFKPRYGVRPLLAEGVAARNEGGGTALSKDAAKGGSLSKDAAMSNRLLLRGTCAPGLSEWHTLSFLDFGDGESNEPAQLRVRRKGGAAAEIIATGATVTGTDGDTVTLKGGMDAYGAASVVEVTVRGGSGDLEFELHGGLSGGGFAHRMISGLKVEAGKGRSAWCLSGEDEDTEGRLLALAQQARGL